MSDFEWVPSYTFTETPEFNTLVSKFENGAEQRRAGRRVPIRKWQLQFKNVPQAIYQQINSFFVSKKGQLESFTWTNLNDDTEYTVRFGEDKIGFIRLANVDVVYRRDALQICAQKLFCLTTTQTWEEYEAVGDDWFDVALDFDTLTVESSGSIEMSTPVDLGVVTRFMVSADPDYTGTANTSLEIQISTSEDGTTYTAYSALGTGVYRARYVKFKILLATSNTLENIFLKNIYFMFESPDTKRAYGNDIAVSQYGTTIFYGDTFTDIPTINVTVIGSNPIIPIITEKTLISFDVKMYDLSGNLVPGEIDWFASGV